MKRTIFLVVLIIFAFIIGFVLVPNYISASTDTVDVVQLTKDVTANTKITGDMLTTTQINKGSIGELIREKNQVIGKYAKTDLYKGSFILPSEIKEASDNSDLLSLGNDKYAFSISTSLDGISGGLLKQGDHVDVVVFVPENKNGTDTVLTPPLLRDIKVIDIRTDNATKYNEKNTDETTSDKPSIVVLEADINQIRELYMNANRGKISLAIRSRDKDVQYSEQSENPLYSTQSQQTQQTTGSVTTNE